MVLGTGGGALAAPCVPRAGGGGTLDAGSGRALATCRCGGGGAKEVIVVERGGGGGTLLAMGGPDRAGAGGGALELLAPRTGGGGSWLAGGALGSCGGTLERLGTGGTLARSVGTPGKPGANSSKLFAWV